MLNYVRLCVLAVCFIVIGFAAAQTTYALPVAAETTTATLSNPTVYNPTYLHAEKVDEIVRASMEAQKIPAISIAIVDKNEIVYAAAFGLANITNNTSAGVLTKFNVGSISKTITAVAALQLAEKGELDLSAPVQAYVPSFPEKTWPVTARHLLCHQGGIRNYKGDEYLSTKRYSDVLGGLEVFKDDPLDFQPGAAYAYGSYGYNLLGAAVEGAAKEPYLEYVQINVLAPSKIDGVFVYDGTIKDPLQASGYSLSDDEIVPADHFDATNKIPAAGFVCSSIDLAKFASAFMKGDLLSSKSMDMMMQPQQLLSGKPTPYGLGWEMSDWNSIKVVAHGGTQPGFVSHLWLVPEKGFAIVIVANLTSTKLKELKSDLRNAVIAF